MGRSCGTRERFGHLGWETKLLQKLHTGTSIGYTPAAKPTPRAARTDQGRLEHQATRFYH